MYLTPAVTALMAWVLFGDRISSWMGLGMFVTAIGVASMSRGPFQSPHAGDPHGSAGNQAASGEDR